MTDLTAVPLPAGAYPAYRRQVIFAACKWDPQLGDVSLIGDHALVLHPAAAARLRTWAERLAAEIVALEQAVARRPDLHARLGLPRRVRRALAAGAAPDQDGIRLMRFDLHPTTTGWSLSEVNSDVPGGLGEAAIMSRLASVLLPATRPTEDPAAAVAAAFASRLPARGRLALVHATAYADDQQVMTFLARALEEQGFTCVLAAPDHLRWNEGRVSCLAAERQGEIHGIVRFFPAEWLPALSRRTPWTRYFRPDVVACNPGTAVLTQSKRLPLLWSQLGVATPTWKALLPTTADPARTPWREDPDWVLKPALGRVGEGIAIRGATTPRELRAIQRQAEWFPGRWVVQRRFASRPVATTAGDRHVCLGVYTVDGRAAGMYGRMSPWPRIDQRAQDVPVVVASTDTSLAEDPSHGA